jgi:hypothetical protein
MSYVEKNGKFNVKKWNRENVHLEEEIITEEYIELMPEVANALGIIKKEWFKWKSGPLTEPGDIKPAAKELKGWISRWMKQTIK